MRTTLWEVGVQQEKKKMNIIKICTQCLHLHHLQHLLHQCLQSDPINQPELSPSVRISTSSQGIHPNADSQPIQTLKDLRTHQHKDLLFLVGDLRIPTEIRVLVGLMVMALRALRMALHMDLLTDRHIPQDLLDLLVLLDLQTLHLVDPFGFKVPMEFLSK